MKQINDIKKTSINLSSKSTNELSLMLGESDRTRVISSALEIAKIIVKQVKMGKHIIVRNEDGGEQEIIFIMT